MIPIVHASGGPLLDIVTADDQGHQTGYYATSPASFAERIHEALSLPADAQLALRRRARQRALDRFDTAAFEIGWAKAWRTLASPQPHRG